MSILDSETRFPQFTLRKHTHPITAQSFIKIPIRNKTKQILDEITGDKLHNIILVPHVFSVDESGYAILWDLSIRRPVLQFQAHTSQIMTVQQLGINDEDEIDLKYFGMVITHGRDHCVKFWRIFDLNGEILQGLIYELPVNALNFSNVIIRKDLLICSNTMDSNTFDIYDIGFLSQVQSNKHNEVNRIDDLRLKRLYEAVDLHKIASQQGFQIDEFKIQRDDNDRVDKFGIIMKFCWINSDTIFIGYESGHVVSFNLDLQNSSIKVSTVTSNHYPNPVLSLTYDKSNNIVISTSIKHELVLHKVQEKSSRVIQLDRFGKISSMGINEGRYIFASWNGYIKFFKLKQDVWEFELIASFKKPIGIIRGDLNIIHNSNDTVLKNPQIVKPNSIIFTKGKSLESSTIKTLSRKDLKVLQNDYLIIGYEDGTIIGYNEF